MSVRDYIDGERVEEVLLVREREVRTKKNGDEYLQLVLADRTGTVPVKVWDNIDGFAFAEAGVPVHIRGRFSVHPKYGADLSPDRDGLRVAEDSEVLWGLLLDGPFRSVDDLDADMKALIATIREPDLVALVRSVFDPGTWARFRDAPAAKQNHHAYKHGLLEHSLQVAQAVSVLCAAMPDVTRDVAVAGAILHDIGKLDVYVPDPLAIDYTTLGRLTGEIPLSYYRVRRVAETLGLREDGVTAGVLHIIMSHHGSLEYGSPVAPCTREAILVHFVDNLSARMGGFERVEKQLTIGDSWSSFDRFLGTYAYFPGRAEAPIAKEEEWKPSQLGLLGMAEPSQ